MPTNEFKSMLAASRDRITEMLQTSSPLQDIGSNALRAWGSGGRQSFGELMDASNQTRLQNEMAAGDMIRQDAQLDMQMSAEQRAEAQDMMQLAQTLTADSEPGSLQRLLQHWDSLPEDFSTMEPSERITALVGAAEGAGIRPAAQRFQSGRHIIERDPETGEYRIAFSTPQDMGPGRAPTQAEQTARALVATGRAPNMDEALLMVGGMAPIPGAPGTPAFEGSGVDQQSYNHMIAITQRMAAGEPLALEDMLTYNAAYQAVAGTQEVRLPDGTVQSVTGQAPAGMPTPQQVAQYSEAPQPWAPTQVAEGTTVSAPPRMTSTDASRVASAEVALQNVDSLQALLYDQAGNLRSDVLATSDLAAFGLSIPGSEGRSAQRITEEIVEVMLRARTGAAAPDAEVERYTRLYAPTTFDSEEDIQRKFNNLRQEIGSTIEYLTGVAPLPTVPLIEGAMETAAPPASGPQAVEPVTVSDWTPAEIQRQGEIANATDPNDAAYGVLLQLYESRDQMSPAQLDALLAAIRAAASGQ